MEIVEHGSRGSHWGRRSNDEELVIHKGRGQIQLSQGEALQLWVEISNYLKEVEGDEP